jgi:hypothetical protein
MNYVVSAVSAGGVATSTTVDASHHSATLSGLADNTNYSVTVTAENAVGSGVASTPVSLTTPVVTTPGTPTITSSTVGNKTLTLQWSAPASDGNSPITSYVISISSPLPTQTITVSSTARTATVSNLTNGTAYTVSMWAVNGKGRGSSTTPVVLTPNTVATAPAITKITGAKGSFTVTWVKSTNTGGAPIQGYQVFLGTKAGSESKTASATSTSTSVQVKNLKKGTYYVIVKALNSAGLSPSSKEKSVKVS